MNLTKIFAILFIALFVNINQLSAQAGSLDSTFDNDGKLVLDILGDLDQCHSVLMQPDGKIVLGGYSHLPGTNYFTIVRLLPDGSMDSTFGNNGVVTNDLAGNAYYVDKLAIQNDGKIIAAGTIIAPSNFSSDFAVLRIHSNGTPDSSFGTNGFVTTDLNFGSNDLARSVKIQNDGKILVNGYSEDSFGDADFALVRYLPDGTLDLAFNLDGIIIKDLGSYDESYGMCLQQDGKIVLSGLTGNTPDFALARFTTDGELDTTFSADGLVSQSFSPGSSDIGADVIQLGNGKLIITGHSWNGIPLQNDDFAMMCFNTDGTLDTLFGYGGMLITDYGNNTDDLGIALALQPDGKILVAGRTVISGLMSFSLLRHNPDGSLDTTFGIGGKAKTDFGFSWVQLGYAVCLQADGKIIVGGFEGENADNDFAIARFHSSDSIVGTMELSANAPDLILFPNPTDGMVEFAFDVPSNQIDVVNIFNIQGQLIRSICCPPAINGKFNLDLTQLPSGLFFVEVCGNISTQIAKVVIQK